MKGKKFYLILVGLIIVGMASLFFYRQQREERALEFEGHEISEIEHRVDALYNKDKTDIVENISEEELEALDTIFLDLKDQGFGDENERRLRDTEFNFLVAQGMNRADIEIRNLFVEDAIIKQDVSLDKVDDLKQEIAIYEDKPVYFDRNIDVLEDASTQIIDIETATEFVDNLFEEDDVRADVTREEEEEAVALIDQIRNEEVKEALIGRVEVVSLALTEMEEALALQEALELEALEEEEVEEECEADEELVEDFEEETEYTAPTTDWNSEPSDSGSGWTPPSNSWSGGSGNSGGSTGSGSTSGGSTGGVYTGNGNTGGGSVDGENVDGTDTENESEPSPPTPEIPEDPVPDEPEDSKNPSDGEPVEAENPTWESQR